jgi:para-nitrobenzyl esterase
MKLFILIACLLACSCTASPIVQTKLGAIRGKLDGTANVFLGVPFAQPPLGDNRFAAPRELVDKFEQTLDATRFKPMCMQRIVAGSSPFAFASEDCLYLNVYAPLNANASSSLATLVFVHGGAFNIGGPQVYNGSRLASKHDAVVVTVAYRLGVFGFSAFSSHDGNDAGESEPIANVGLLDQRAALRFVQQNIDAFGGDPKRVTLFGESAGGGSVFYHNFASASWPLFASGVAESPGVWAVASRERAAAATNRFGVALKNCSDAAPGALLRCMRAMSAEALLPDTSSAPWTPTLAFVPSIDDDFLPDQPLQLLNNGKWSQKPLMLGWNAREETLFALVNSARPPPMLAAAYSAHVARSFGNCSSDHARLAPFVEQTYASSAKRRGKWATYGFEASDWGLMARCPRLLAPSLRASSSAVFMYYFDHVPSKGVFNVLGATHTTELPFVFSEPEQGGMQFNDVDWSLAHRMSAMWCDFARSGVPSSSWPDYRQHMLVQTLKPSMPNATAYPNTDETACQWEPFYLSGQYPQAEVF